MEKVKPFGINLISYFYFFGIALVFITLFSSSANISGYSFATVIGLPFLSELAAKILLILSTAPVIWGFYQQKKWGYWVMIFYSIYFLLVSSYLAGIYSWQPFAGNAIWSLIVLAYTFWRRDFFRL